VFNTGEQVTPAQLVARHVVRSISRKPPTVKILALGTLTKKLTVAGCAVSNTARAAIEAAGGSVL
jgi:large subunit ribosomal protein L15